jgi:hypothetical protein
MTRFLVIAAVLGLVGCATDIVDPLETPTDEPQRDPPAQTLSGELDSPGDDIAIVTGNGGPSDLGPQTPLPIPPPGE